jgi:hypothetical protein
VSNCEFAAGSIPALGPGIRSRAITCPNFTELDLGFIINVPGTFIGCQKACFSEFGRKIDQKVALFCHFLAAFLAKWVKTCF